MNYYNILAAAAGVVASIGAAPAFSAPVITGYSFESPDLHGSGFQEAPFAEGTTFLRAGVTTPDGNFGAPLATDGSQLAYISSGGFGQGVITLAVSGLTAGSSYNFVFDAAISPYYIYGTNGLTMSFGGFDLGTVNPTTLAFASFTTNTFVAAGSTGILTFTATPANYTVSFIDNVRINVAGAVVAVPEPETWTMLLAGFGMVGFGLRRRNATRTIVNFA